MPIRFWTYPCCSVRAGRRICESHGQPGVSSRWLLGMHEAMYRYQLRFGWQPIGPHRQLGDALYAAIATGCPACDGDGLIDRLEGTDYAICESCFGFGSLPLPGAAEIHAIREQVGREFPEALTPYAPATAIRRLASVLCGGAPVVHDLQSGVMITASDRPRPSSPG